MIKPFAKFSFPKISNLSNRIAVSALLGLGVMPMTTVLAAPASDPIAPWVYGAMTQLVKEGYMEQPKRPFESYSRQELGDMTAKALTKIEDSATDALLNELCRTSSRLVVQETQLKLAKGQERADTKAGNPAPPINQPAAAVPPQPIQPNQPNPAYNSNGTLKNQIDNYTREIADLKKRQHDLLTVIVGSDEDVSNAESPANDSAIEETSRLNRLLNSENSKIRQAAEQENTAKLKYYSDRISAARTVELYVRGALRGENRLEVMKPLKDKSDEAQSKLEDSACDYAEARRHTEQLLRGSAGSSKDDLFTIDEFGRLSRLLVMDEVQLKLAKEQEKTAGDIYAAANADAAQAAEAYARTSLEERSNKDRISVFKTKSDKALSMLEFAAMDYAAAKRRVVQRAKMLDCLRKRQHELLTSPDNTALVGDGAKPAYDNTRRVKPTEYTATTYTPPFSPISDSALNNAVRLRAEFISELDENSSLDNMNARMQLSSNITVKEVPKNRFTADVELRIDTGHYGGEDGIGNRTRVRTRIYPDYNIDGNWHIKGMIEWEKAISGQQSKNDGKVRLDRYYLSGNIGEVHTDIGAFGSLMAEGNIYDSKFKGVRLIAGNPVKYGVEYGKVDRDHIDKTLTVTASYDATDYKVEGGYYYFKEKGGRNRNIIMTNYRQPLGIFDLGAMLLYGRDSGQSGKVGYILTLDYAPANSWKPYTYNGWIRYYHQPSSTYVSHTMNGMADNMSHKGGFKGWGIGLYYNLPNAWSIGFEFYHLKDLLEGKVSNTTWFSLNKSLSVNKDPNDM